MLPFIPDRAALSEFEIAPMPILVGDALVAMRKLEQSVLVFGMLAPIVASRQANGKLRVIDGQQRIAVVRRLDFAGKLPRSLQKIPYILADEPVAPSALGMLSQIEQYEQVERLAEKGLDETVIAAMLYAPETMVRNLMSVRKLSPRLKNAFFGGHIDLSQARAFATLPNPDSQDALLMALGPFVDAPSILAAIAAGDTVLTLGQSEDDTLILPSRTAA